MAGYVQKVIRPGGIWDGSWRARFRGPDGKMRSKSFAKKRDADAWLVEQQSSLAKGTFVDPRQRRYTFGDLLDSGLATSMDLRPSAAEHVDDIIRSHLRPTWGDIPLDRITGIAIQSWIAGLLANGRVDGKGGLSPGRIKLIHVQMNKFLSIAVDNNLLGTNPATKVKLPRIIRKEQRFLDHDEIARVAASVDPRYRALILVAAYGGLRFGELAGLRRIDVSAQASVVSVRWTVVAVRGVLHQGPPKTAAGVRDVPLPEQAAAALAEHMDDSTSKHVFTSPGGQLLRESTWRPRFWLPALTKAGVAHLRPHDLRHTAVSMWIASGASPKEVAALAGHASASFTLDRYGHLFPGQLHAVAERVGAAIAAAEAAERRRTIHVVKG